ncbi:MAG: exodeoxyribonuclease VII small subunit [Marmoricola sp.]
MSTDVDDLSYEDARDQLVEVVRTLEQGGTTLAESLALWERGEELARVCQEALEGARARLDEVVEGQPAQPGQPSEAT